MNTINENIRFSAMVKRVSGHFVREVEALLNKPASLYKLGEEITLLRNGYEVRGYVQVPISEGVNVLYVV